MIYSEKFHSIEQPLIETFTEGLNQVVSRKHELQSLDMSKLSTTLG